MTCPIHRLAPALAMLALVALLPAGPADAAPCSADPSTATTAAPAPAPLPRLTLACRWSERQAAELLTVLAEAGSHGLDPAAFAIPPWPAGHPERDRALTDAALRYARIMMQGRIDPAAIDDDIAVQRPQAEPGPELRAALERDDVGGWLRLLPPVSADYAGLRQALAVYRAIGGLGGWPLLPPRDSVLEPGRNDPAVPALRQRLRGEGDLAPAAAPEPDDLYDAVTVAAVQRFQRRHGLNPDGRIGRATLAELNTSVEARIDQIAVNLERHRASGRAVATSRVEVNVPAATAVLVRDGVPALAMQAVVGDRRHPTPVVGGTITSIVINPPWIVPYSIISKEIRPLLEKDPDYLARNRMDWETGENGARRLVQAPGPGNALGRIKFNFANPFAVYLHDTPARRSFARDDRARSHGCVRLEFAVDLGAALLQQQTGWSKPEIEQAIAAEATVRIPLRQPMPVRLTYWTAFVGTDGTIEFRRDVYGRDARLRAALARQAAVTPLPIAAPPAPRPPA